LQPTKRSAMARPLIRFAPMSQEHKERLRAEIVENCDRIADCWVYRGTKNPKLCYGIKYIQGKKRTVSRFMLAYHTRESLDLRGYDACHIRDCPYRACCNPQHLFWGAHTENCKQREAYEQESRESRLLELPNLYAQPALGHQMHCQ
jgi:hypothetical protein